MDAAEYLPLFLAEAREHLQALNLAIVRLEADPRDRATLEEIFRAAHSLKGMSATMGFAAIAALTHEAESVLEPLRDGERTAPAPLVDALLAALDALERAVDGIEADGVERLDPAPLVAGLRAAVAGGPAPTAAATAPATVPEDGPPPAVVAAAAGRPLWRLRATLDPATAMPSVRAFMVLAACAELGDVLGSTPAADAVDGFAGGTVEVWLAADPLDPELVDRTVGAVGDVVAAVAEPVAAPLPAPAPAADAPPTPTPTPTATAPRRAATVRVDAERLDQLMHRMGELVVHRTHVEALVAGSEQPELRTALQDLQRSSHALQQLVMQVRMVPVETVFLRFPRLVRDLAGRLGKRVDLRLVGQETELDRTVVDALGDPLVHLVRNALDHGLEPPAARRAAGKPETGRLTIAARHRGGQVLIEVADDGRGIDVAAVAARAVERGLLAPDQRDRVDRRAAAELLFAPGFSTAAATSDISGRGVGMDAVRTAIGELGGDVAIDPAAGAGTTVAIRLPLTLAITAALLVTIGGCPFALPLDRVERIVRLADESVRSVAGRPVLVERDATLPLVDGAAAFAVPDADEAPFAVVVHGRAGRAALTVGALAGQHELVTRPLPATAAQGVAVAGGAVLASGEIALIVDADALTTDAHPAAAAALA
ncbi:chemotaxis protein CheA [Patulibacter defluvii]|uniref:chemotaxis protein CheA n=1 Tax=Patulibacter defluvii TaxID=3095358 RepID=UPI002A75B2CD|nr:chemotaxis protein CheA [Patulibacter sp. DM4]